MSETLWNDWGAQSDTPAPADLSADWGNGRDTYESITAIADGKQLPAVSQEKPAALPQTPQSDDNQQADADAQADADRAATASPDQTDEDSEGEDEDVGAADGEGEYDAAAFACFGALRETWGADFEANLEAAKTIVSDAPQGISDFLRTGEFEDGSMIANSPEVLGWLHSLVPGNHAPLPAAPIEQTAPETEEQSAAIQATSAELQAMWGKGWQSTLQGVKNLVYAAPPLVREVILSAQYVDGSYVANDPLVLGWLAQYLPGGQPVDAEIADIEAKIGTREYMRNEAMQTRLRSLYAVRGH